MPNMKMVAASREENASYMNGLLPIKESFDIIQRDMVIGGRMSSFYFIDGFTKDESMLKIMDSLFHVKEEDMPADATQFSRKCIPYVEVDVLVYLTPPAEDHLWQFRESIVEKSMEYLQYLLLPQKQIPLEASLDSA